MPIILPILLVAAVAGYFIYEQKKKTAAAPSAPGSTPATTAGAYAAMAQAGAFARARIPVMQFQAQVPHIEDQMGQVGAIPMMQHRPGAHVPHIEDQVAAAAMMYPHFGVHPMSPLDPTWQQIRQTEMPMAAQADLLKQVRLKNLRGFYKTEYVFKFYGLYVGDPRDMRSYVWYLGPSPIVAPRNPAL